MSQRPTPRAADTYEFVIGGGAMAAKGWLTISAWDEGFKEIFIKLSKHGSTLGGMTETVAILVSTMAQKGVSTYDIVEALIGMRFEPMGGVEDTDVRFAQSIPDYIGRKIAALYLSEKERLDLGIEVVR